METTFDILNAQHKMDQLAFEVSINNGDIAKKLGYTPNTIAYQFISDLFGNVRNAKSYKDIGAPMINGYAFGCKIFLRGKTVSLVPVSPNQYGKMDSPIGPLKCNIQYDIPVKWFAPIYTGAIKRINILNEGWNNKSVDFVWKMLAMSRDMATYRGLIETMLQNPHTKCDAKIAWGKMTVLKVDPSKIKGFIRVDLVNMGLYTEKFVNSVFAFNRGNTVYSMEALNKANERVTKIAQSKGVGVGNRKVFVVDNVEGHLARAFCTGSIFAPTSFIEQVGIARITSKKLGMKGVIMPIPFEDQIKGGCDFFIVAKSGAKANRNGVAYAKGLDPVKQHQQGVDAINELLDSSMESVSFGGITLNGWFVEDSIRITNLYALYGYNYKDEDVIDEDGNIEEVIEKGSLHQHAISELANDNNFDVVGMLMDGINNGEILERKDIVSLKYQDMLNVYFSYGSEVHDRLLSIATEKSMRHSPRGHIAAQRMVFNGFKDASRISGSDILHVINEVWKSDFDEIINTISVGKWEHRDDDPAFKGREKYSMLMEGFGKWVGFENLANGLVIEHKGFEFLIPSWDILSKGIFEDGDVVHFSGAWRAIFLLFIALRNENTNWVLKHVQHHTDMQDELTRDILSRIYVPGRYYVALPKWWDDKISSVVIPGYKFRTNKRVMYAKDPVLFDSAICDVIVQKGLPSCFKFNDRIKFAMSDACFVHTNLLLWQQNDTDGDLVCIRRMGNIVPLYNGQMKETKKWVEKYVEGEMDLKTKAKEYKEFTIQDLGQAVDHAANAKGEIGIMSSNLFLVQHLLQQAIVNGVISFNDARLIKETYAIMVQEEAIKQIKAQMTTGETFFSLATLSDPWAEKKADRICSAFDLAKDIAGFEVDPEVVHEFAKFAINVLLKSNFGGFRTQNILDNKLASRYTQAQRGNIHIFNWFQRSYFNNMKLHVPAISHLKERNTSYMNEYQQRAYYAKKNFAEAFISNENVRNGFWGIHGIIRKNGITIKQEPQDISCLKWLYFLGSAINEHDFDKDPTPKKQKNAVTKNKENGTELPKPVTDEQMAIIQNAIAQTTVTEWTEDDKLDLPWIDTHQEHHQADIDLLEHLGDLDPDYSDTKQESSSVDTDEANKKEEPEVIDVPWDMPIEAEATIVKEVKAKKQVVKKEKPAAKAKSKDQIDNEVEEWKKARRSEAAKKAAATRAKNKAAKEAAKKNEEENKIDLPWDTE